MLSTTEDADRVLAVMLPLARVDSRVSLGSLVFLASSGLSEARAAAALEFCCGNGWISLGAPRPGDVSFGSVRLTAAGLQRAEQQVQAALLPGERARALREALLRWVAGREDAGGVALLEQHQVDGDHDGDGERLFGLAVDWTVVGIAFRDLAERGLLRITHRPPASCGHRSVQLALSAAGRDFVYSGHALADFLTARPIGASSMHVENAAFISGPVSNSAVAVGTRNTATATTQVGARVDELVQQLRVLGPLLQLDEQTAADFDHEVQALEQVGTEQPAAGRAWRSIRRMLPATLVAAGAEEGVQRAVEGAIALGTSLFGG
ncbi:hypothetical protein ACWEO1_16845 [Kitasatospora cineracea]